MVLLPLLLVAADDTPARVAAMLSEYHAGTRAGPLCTAPADKDEITVCARRQADQWRVPYIENDPGDPKHESVRDERARYIRQRTPCQERGPFLIGCGMAGVTMTVGFGGPNAEKARIEKPRPPAP